MANPTFKDLVAIDELQAQITTLTELHSGALKEAVDVEEKNEAELQRYTQQVKREMQAEIAQESLSKGLQQASQEETMLAQKQIEHISTAVTEFISSDQFVNIVSQVVSSKNGTLEVSKNIISRFASLQPTEIEGNDKIRVHIADAVYILDIPTTTSQLIQHFYLNS